MLASVAADRRATSRAFRAFVTNYITNLSSPWRLAYSIGDGKDESPTYSGSVTCPGGFAKVEKYRFEECDTLKINKESFEFNVAFSETHVKEIRFAPNREGVEIRFELFKNGEPMDKGGIFIGPKYHTMMEPSFTLNINDERFKFGESNRRLAEKGIFIYAAPTRYREQLQPDLTPEMVEELRSLGYLN